MTIRRRRKPIQWKWNWSLSKLIDNGFFIVLLYIYCVLVAVVFCKISMFLIIYVIMTFWLIDDKFEMPNPLNNHWTQPLIQLVSIKHQQYQCIAPNLSLKLQQTIMNKSWTIIPNNPNNNNNNTISHHHHLDTEQHDVSTANKTTLIETFLSLPKLFHFQQFVDFSKLIYYCLFGNIPPNFSFSSTLSKSPSLNLPPALTLCKFQFQLTVQYSKM